MEMRYLFDPDIFGCSGCLYYIIRTYGMNLGGAQKNFLKLLIFLGKS